MLINANNNDGKTRRNDVKQSSYRVLPRWVPAMSTKPPTARRRGVRYGRICLAGRDNSIRAPNCLPGKIVRWCVTPILAKCFTAYNTPSDNKTSHDLFGWESFPLIAYVAWMLGWSSRDSFGRGSTPVRCCQYIKHCSSSPANSDLHVNFYRFTTK